MAHGLTTLLGLQLFDGAGAVWTFFAISGFLITIALTSKYRGGADRLTHFYWNRLVRLYPAYWAWVLLTMVAYLVIPAAALTYQRFIVDGSIQASGFWSDHAEVASAGTLALAALANLSGVFSDAFLSLALNPDTGQLVANPRQDGEIWAMGFMFIGQYWSIGVELCFYALAPWIIRGVFRVALLFLFSASGLLEQAWVGATIWAGFAPALSYLQAPKYLWMFMVGSALGHVYLAARRPDARRRFWGAMGVVAFMYGYIAWRGTSLFPIQAFPWWVFVLLTAAIPLLFATTRANRYDRFAGDLSYPVYVNHFIVIQVLGSFAAPNGFMFAVASVSLAAITIFLVERPAQLRKLA